MKFYRQLGVIFLGLGLTNCLEPQAAPKLDRPVQNFTISTLASNLDTPWSVTPLPRILDDNGVNTPAQYLITERDGQLKKYSFLMHAGQDVQMALLLFRLN